MAKNKSKKSLYGMVKEATASHGTALRDRVDHQRLDVETPGPPKSQGRSNKSSSKKRRHKKGLHIVKEAQQDPNIEVPATPPRASRPSSIWNAVNVVNVANDVYIPDTQEEQPVEDKTARNTKRKEQEEQPLDYDSSSSSASSIPAEIVTRPNDTKTPKTRRSHRDSVSRKQTSDPRSDRPASPNLDRTQPNQAQAKTGTQSTRKSTPYISPSQSDLQNAARQALQIFEDHAPRPQSHTSSVRAKDSQITPGAEARGLEGIQGRSTSTQIVAAGVDDQGDASTCDSFKSLEPDDSDSLDIEADHQANNISPLDIKAGPQYNDAPNGSRADFARAIKSERHSAPPEDQLSNNAANSEADLEDAPAHGSDQGSWSPEVQPMFSTNVDVDGDSDMGFLQGGLESGDEMAEPLDRIASSPLHVSQFIDGEASNDSQGGEEEELSENEHSDPHDIGQDRAIGMVESDSEDGEDALLPDVRIEEDENSSQIKKAHAKRGKEKNAKVAVVNGDGYRRQQQQQTTSPNAIPALHLESGVPVLEAKKAKKAREKKKSKKKSTSQLPALEPEQISKAELEGSYMDTPIQTSQSLEPGSTQKSGKKKHKKQKKTQELDGIWEFQDPEDVEHVHTPQKDEEKLIANDQHHRLEKRETPAALPELPVEPNKHSRTLRKRPKVNLAVTDSSSPVPLAKRAPMKAVPGRFSDEERQIFEDIVEKHRVDNEMTQFEINHLVQGQRGSSTSHARFWTDIKNAFPHMRTRKLRIYGRKNFHNFVARGRWTPEQDDELRTMVDTYGEGKWAQISTEINRHPEDVRDRWRNHVVCGKNRRTCMWSNEEQTTLVRLVIDAIKKIDSAGSKKRKRSANIDVLQTAKLIDWPSISTAIGGTRSRQQCMAKWARLEEKMKPDQDIDRVEEELGSLQTARAEYRQMTMAQKMAIVKGIRDCKTFAEYKIRWKVAVPRAIHDRFCRQALQLAWFRMKAHVPDYKDKDVRTICRQLVQMYGDGSVQAGNAGDESNSDDEFDSVAIQPMSRLEPTPRPSSHRTKENSQTRKAGRQARREAKKARREARQALQRVKQEDADQEAEEVRQATPLVKARRQSSKKKRLETPKQSGKKRKQLSTELVEESDLEKGGSDIGADNTSVRSVDDEEEQEKGASEDVGENMDDGILRRGSIDLGSVSPQESEAEDNVDGDDDDGKAGQQDILEGVVDAFRISGKKKGQTAMPAPPATPGSAVAHSSQDVGGSTGRNNKSRKLPTIPKSRGRSSKRVREVGSEANHKPNKKRKTTKN